MTLPLVGIRVIDTTDGRGEMCGRFLADLGADVVLVEPPGGAASRRAHPVVDGVSCGFAVRAANKRSVVLDLADEPGQARFGELLAAADVWVDGHRPGSLGSVGLDPATVHARFPRLVIIAITDFGLTGPYRDWVANDWVLFALGGQLSRSGVPGRPPLMLPGELADETTAIQAAWAVLLALWNRERTGAGDLLDMSRHEATAQVVDPPFGSIGTAAAQSGSTTSEGRAPALLYPIFRCADGYVRVVVLAPRQWHAMRSWLGEPHEFSDPKYDLFGRRVRAADRLYPLIAELFATRTAGDVVAEGQRRGIPIAPVLTPAEATRAEHFAARKLFVELEHGDGRSARAPAGHVLIDGQRAGIRTTAPTVGADTSNATWTARPPEEVTRLPRRRAALEGLRVLDLGVIVMGGEAGRLFADQGADVIKVENRRFPDGARAAGMTAQFASGHRNKRSLAVDLRHPDGITLFERLVAHADVLLSNFKPGTLESLGLGPDRLRQLHPGLVVVTSSAMGESGPWRDWMGYGPLVRCVSGLTDLWCDPEATDGFGDSTTIYPDHFVARIVDVAALAALIRRHSTGLGAHIESSQAEAIIVALGPQFLRESLEPGSLQPMLHGEVDAPWGVYRCAGDDGWCTVTVRDDSDWSALVAAIGAPAWASDPQLRHTEGRLAARMLIDTGLEEWTSTRSAHEVMTVLQRAGVPAGAMTHIAELLADPQLIERGFFRHMHQPGLGRHLPVENGPCRAENLTDPDMRPAPYYGQHTREICRTILGLDDATIDDLVARGVLDELSERDASSLQADD